MALLHPGWAAILNLHGKHGLFWDVDGDNEPKSLDLRPGTLDALGISRDGKLLLYAMKHDTTLSLVDLPSGKELASFESPESPFGRMSISPGGRYAAAATPTGKVYLWRFSDQPLPEGKAPPADTAPKADANPFVILSGKGVAERKFATLAEAVLEASSGDTIEIRGNGPFVTEPIVLSVSAVTIRAGAGYRPVIKSKPNEAGKGPASLFLTDGPLTLEGLELHHRHNSFVPNSCVVSCEEGPLMLANCRFVRSPRIKTIFSDAAIVEARNCEFLSEPISLLDNHFWSTLRSKGHLNLVNNVFVSGNTAVVLISNANTLAESRVVLHNNTFLTRRAVTLALDSVPQGPIQIEATGNIFDLRLAMFELWYPPLYVIKEPAPDEDTVLLELPKILAWRDHRNLYSPKMNMMHMSAHNSLLDQPLAGMARLKEWSDYWKIGSTSGIEGRALYEGGNLIGKATVSLQKLLPADARLVTGSPGKGKGEDGKDIGINVDLVGPGAAYERWKETPEYEQWFKDTKQVK